MSSWELSSSPYRWNTSEWAQYPMLLGEMWDRKAMRRPKISGRKRASTGSDITVNPGDSYFIQLERPHGPNCYELAGERVTIMDGEELRDQWNTKDSNRQGQDEAWCGQTIFFKKRESKPEVIRDKFLQHGRLSSQGGFITFFYDSRMETEEKSYPISIVNWKSFRIKRCTVNTLSAECQAMLQGVGALHWLRFLIQEIHGQDLRLEDWEARIGEIPCIAVTDSKSLYDTINKCCNTSAHIEDKRTAIDVTILKRDFSHTRGQVRWIEGTRMISDSLTKKMGSHFLRKVMSTGTWSLSEIGFREEQDALLLMVSTDESLAGVNSSPVRSGWNHFSITFQMCSELRVVARNSGLGFALKKARVDVSPTTE